MPATSSTRPLALRGLLTGLGLLLLLTLGLTLYFYFTGDTHTFPVGTVAQLTPVPVTVDWLAVGADSLALQANGYLVTQTRDVAGPELWPLAAILWVVVLGLSLVGWLAIISQQNRPAFLAGAAAVIFLLMSLSLDLLGAFGERHQYFLILSIVLLPGVAFVLHAFFSDVALGWRLLLFAGLVVATGGLLFARSPQPALAVVLHLAAYGTMPGTTALALLALWLGVELIYGLLWLNTQGPTVQSRYGLLPFLLSSGLVLGVLLLYYFNDGQLNMLPGIGFEPYLLLLVAAAAGWRSLPRRLPTYSTWLTEASAAPLYLVAVLFVLGTLAYAAATANQPLLRAGRDFTVLAFAVLSGIMLLYVLVNFAPLIRQRLQVYRVAYEPRRVPFFAVYVIGIGIIGSVLMRNNFELLDVARAGQYVQLGDLTRQQSEEQPDNLYLALLAERYYAEADQLDPRNARAALGRAALYQARAQRQNEINILRTTLVREPNEKVLLRLAARFDEPNDFFDRQGVLRQGLKAFPASAMLNAEMAQLFSRSALVDSVQHYYQRAVAADESDPLPPTNWIAFLLKNNAQDPARQAAEEAKYPDWPAWQNNVFVLDLLRGRAQAVAAGKVAVDTALTVPQFAQLYHVGMAQATRRDTTLLPSVRRLQQTGANDQYADQLNFLSGLQLLRGGSPAAGFDRLALLASGATGGYYHQLLGQYLLERGLYASAAERLDLAEASGNSAAAVPRAYALTWAGQLDSARAAALRAAQNVPASAPAMQRLLSGQIRPPAALARPLGAEFERAQKLALQDPKAAAKLYQRLARVDPFDEVGVLQAADFFRLNNNTLAAYELTREALYYNPESIQLLQRYVLAAADAGLQDYSMNSLDKIRTLLPPTEYQLFSTLYDKRRAAHRAAVAPWN